MRSALFLTLLCLCLAPIASGQDLARPWLDRAQRVGLWLRSLEALHGEIPVDALEPGAVRDDLASGRAGQLLFWVSLYRARGDYESLAALRRTADSLVAAVPEEIAHEGFPPSTSLHYGWAGAGWALELAFRETRDPEYRLAAEGIARLLVQSARLDDDGHPYWDDRFDELHFGNTGTALFLLFAASEMGDDEAMRIARGFGDRLLASAVREGGRWTWPMRRDRPEMILPNFSHGAAGIGYYLATLSMATGDGRYLDGALAAARMLEYIATRDRGVVLYPYGFGREQWEGRAEIGWAHGVAGTARLFERLHQMTGDPRWSTLVEECSFAIHRSNAPDEPALGFGDAPFSLDWRFGLAGVGAFLVDRSRTGGGSYDLDLALRIGDHMVERGSADAIGLFWETPRPAFATRPGEPARFTGWMTGAIGQGLLFLKLHAATTGAVDPVPALDTPFGFVPVSGE